MHYDIHLDYALYLLAHEQGKAGCKTMEDFYMVYTFGGGFALTTDCTLGYPA